MEPVCECRPREMIETPLGYRTRLIGFASFFLTEPSPWRLSMICGLMDSSEGLMKVLFFDC